MAVKQLWPSPPQFVDANGDPYSGALLFFYASGSSTKQNVYTDSGGGTAASNPTTLNSSGYPANSGTIFTPFGTVGQTYKIGLAAPGSSDPPASFLWSVDNIAPTNDVSVSIDQWVIGPAPTYISATQFSLVGDQTSDFQVGRRLKTTNSGGTVYSTITASAYGAVTTVTVVNDSGTLDAGLSAVSYGLLSPTNPSTPLLADTYPIVSGSADKTKKVRLEADGITTATTRVVTVPDADTTLPIITSGMTIAAFTTAGDIWQASGAGVAARLGIGSARQVPTVNAGATALAYTNPITLGTATASTSGTSIDFAAPFAGVRRLTVNLVGVSTNGTSNRLFQIGTSGTPQTSGYLGASNFASTPANFTAGIGVNSGSASDVMHGTLTFTLVNASANTWVATGVFGTSGTTQVFVTGGSVSLSGALDIVRCTTANGTDAFDAGSINVTWE